VVAVRGRKLQAIALAATLGGVAVGWRLAREAAPAERHSPAARGSSATAASITAASASAAAPTAPVRPAPLPPADVTSLAGPRGPAERAATGEADPDAALAAAKLERRMLRFLSDLEYSPGLAEPPQQVIAPVPPPWTPAPALAGLPDPVIDEISPLAAAVGAHVSIRGRHLRVSQVMFGERPAEVVSDGDDHVTVLAPAGGHGVVSVGVTNVDGTYAVADDAFTYVGGDQ
jgi:hypothetical protein